MRILFDEAPADGNGNGDDTKPKAPAVPAGTPAVVKKTALKTPNEIRLEKELAATQDKIASLEGWKGEVDALLESIGAGSAAPVKIKPGPVPEPKTRGGFFADVENDIWGTPPTP